MRSNRRWAWGLLGAAMLGCGSGDGGRASANPDAGGGSADDGLGGGDNQNDAANGDSGAPGGEGKNDGGTQCDDGFAGAMCDACAPGYVENEAGSCVPACDVVECGAHGRCAVSDQGLVTCDCNVGYAGDVCDQCADGYLAKDDTCQQDPCAATSCTGHSHCEIDGTTASCACDAGYAGAECVDCADGYQTNPLDATSCIFDACIGVACGHGACVQDGMEASCDCDEGYDGAACDACASGYSPTKGGDCELRLPLLSDLAVWQDASRADLITTGANGEISAWKSAIPGKNATMNSALVSQRPSLVDGPRGLKVVRYDGVSDRTRLSAISLPGDYTIFVVTRPSATQGTQAILAGVDNDGQDDHGLLLESRDGATAVRFLHRSPFGPSGGDSVQANAGLTAGAYQLYTATRYAFSAEHPYLQSVMTDATTASDFFTSEPFADTFWLYFGMLRGSGSERALSGDIAEVIIYSRKLDQDQRDSVRAYLAAKWAL